LGSNCKYLAAVIQATQVMKFQLLLLPKCTSH
jgi:hypothetical protein